MKKILSLLICLTMLSSVICGTVSATPERPEPEPARVQNGNSIELPDVTLPGNPEQTSVIKSVAAGRITIIRGYDCYEDYYYDEATDDYVYYTRYDYSYCHNDIVLTFQDNSQIELYCLGYGFYYENEYYYITMTDDQEKNPWGVGVHTVNCSVLDFNFTVEVEIIETVVTGVEMNNDIIIVENCHCFENSYYDDETGDYVRYNHYNFMDVEAGFTVHFENGEDCEVSKLNGSVYYNDGYYDFKVNDNQHDAPWGVGVHTVTCSVMNYEFSVDVHIVACPITDIEVGQITLVKELDGWWSDYYDDDLGEYVRYFNYDVLRGKPGVTVRIAGQDPFTSDRINGWVGYGGLNYSFDYINTQSEDPWGIGDHVAHFTIMGYEFDVPVKIVNSHITGIEVGRISIIEGTGMEEAYYNGERYNRYNYTGSDVDMTVYFDDSDPVKVSQLRNWVYYNDGSYQITIDDDGQKDEPWGVGVHTVTCHLMNYDFTVEVEILPSPVTGVTVEPIKIVKGFNGYNDQYYDDEKGEWVDYYRYNYNNNDVSITVYFRDEDPVQLSSLRRGFEYNGKYYYINLGDDGQYGAPWGVGEHLVPCSVLGFDFDLPVRIIETPVTNVETETITIVKGFNCYDDSYYDNEKGEWVSYNRYDYGYIDTAITVYFEDGDPVTVDRLRRSVNYAGGSYGISCEDDQQTAPWDLGVHEVRCSLLGYDFTVNVEIIDTPVTAIEADPIRIIKGTNTVTSVYYDDVLGRDVEYERYAFEDGRTHIVIRTLDGGEYELGSLNDGFYYINNWVNIETADDGQKNEPWGIGIHTVTCRVLNYEFTVNVEILPSPVTGVEMKPIRIVEGHFCYNDSYYDDTLGEWVEYTRYDYQHLDSDVELIFEDGRRIRLQALGGVFEYDGDYYGITVSDDQRENKWTVGTHNVSCSVLGYEFTAQVDIIASPVTEVDAGRMTIVKGCHCFEQEYYDDALGETATFMYYDVFDYDVTTSLRIVFSDAEPVTIKRLGDAVDYDGTEYYIDWEDDQFENHWDVGVHTVRGKVLGYDFTLEVEIIESPVADVSAGRMTMVKNCCGWADWYYDGEERIDFYNYDLMDHSCTVTVTLNAGDPITVGRLADGIEYKGVIYRIEVDNDQYDAPWGVGVHTVNCRVMGYDFTAEVEIIESPVASVVSEPITLIEGNAGYNAPRYDSELGGYTDFYRYSYSDKPFNIVATLTDGSTVKLNNLNSSAMFEGASYNVQSRDPQYDEPWGAGVHYVTCRFMDFEFTVTVNIIENPVENVTAAPVTFYEGAFNGTNWERDPDTGEYITYSYYAYRYMCNYTVYFKDGTTYTFNGNSFEYAGVSYQVNTRDDQSRTNVWGVGDHQAFCRLLGMEFPITVTILSTPVTNVTADNYRIIENTHCHNDVYYDDFGNPVPIVIYDDVYRDARITVEFNDGTSTTVRLGSGVNFNGSWFNVTYNDGQGRDDQWGPGVHQVRCTLLGYEFTLNVEIIETPVDHVDAPEIVLFENTFLEESSYFDNDKGEWVDFTYYNYVSACNFTVYFKDGTSAEIVNGRSVEYDGLDIFFDREDDQSADNVWDVNTHEAGGRIGGFPVTFYVKIVENPIVGFDVKDATLMCVAFNDFRDMLRYIQKNVTFEITTDGGETLTGNLFDGINVNGVLVKPATDDVIDPWLNVGTFEYECELGGVRDTFTLTVIPTPFDGGVDPEPQIRIPENAEKERRTGFMNGEEIEYYAYGWSINDAKVILRSTIGEHILASDSYVENDEYTKDEYDRAWAALEEAGIRFAESITDCAFDDFARRLAEETMGMTAEELADDRNLMYLFAGLTWGCLAADGEGRYVGAYSGRTYAPGEFTAKEIWEELVLQYTDDKTGVVDYAALSEHETGYDTLFRCVEWEAGIERYVMAHNGEFTYEGRKYHFVTGDDQMFEPWTVGDNNFVWVDIVDEDGAIYAFCGFRVEVYKAIDIQSVTIASETLYEYESYEVQTPERDFREYDLTPDSLDVKIKVNGKTTAVGLNGWWNTYADGSVDIVFYYEDDEYHMYLYGWQNEGLEWVDGENEIRYNVGGVEGSFTVTIIGIQSIVVDDMTIISGSQCDENGIYDYFPHISVTYTDGTYITSDEEEFHNRYYTEITDSQGQTKWGVGKHNAYVSLNGGNKVKFTVEILNNPVESVSAKNVRLFEDKEGHYLAVYDSKTGQYVRGEEYRGQIYATATFKNGSTVSGESVIEYEGETYSAFITGISDMLNPYCLGSGTHLVNFELMGKTGTFKIIVMESYYDTHAVVVSEDPDLLELFNVLDDDKFEKGTIITINEVYEEQPVYDAIKASLDGNEHFSAVKITAINDGALVKPTGSVRITFNLGPDAAGVDLSKLAFFSCGEDGVLHELDATVDEESLTATFELNDDVYYAFALIVEESVFGDANGDGEVDNKDVVALFRYLSGYGGYILAENLDFNHDGRLNNKDVTLLYRFISRKS